MKKIVVVMTMVGLLSSALLCGSAFAGLDTREMLNKLDIVAVKEMAVRSAGARHYLDLTVMMRNENDSDIKMTDCDFAVKLGSKKYSPTYIGNARRSEIVVRSVGTDSSAGSEAELQINLGSDQGKVLQTLTYVMNIVGNPTSQAIVVLDGSAIPFVRVKRGFVNENNDRVNINGWEWTPKLQKELLME